MSRPTAWTQEIQDNVCDHIRSGTSLEASAALSGIAIKTFWNWLAAGNALIERLDAEPDYELSENEALFLGFLQAVTQARAEMEELAVKQIVKAGSQGISYTTQVVTKKGDVVDITTTIPPDARHMEWLLERSFWKTYGRRNNIELTGENGGAVKVQHTIELPTDLESYRDMRKAMLEANLPLPELEEGVVDAEILEEM